VEITDQLGGKSFGPGVDIQIIPTGVTVTPSSGQTDANGIFATRVEVPAGTSAAAVLAAGGLTQDIFLNVNASLDGTTTQKLLSASVEDCVIDDFLPLNSQEDVDAAAGVCRVERVLEIDDDGSGTPITDLSPLSDLRLVSEGILIRGTALTDLTGLEGVLFDENASIAIQNNASLANIDALASAGGSNISEFGAITISDNPALSSLAGLANVDRGGGMRVFLVTISNNDGLGSLNGMSDVSWVTNALNIVDNDVLTSLGGLGPVITAGTVHVAQNASLTSLSALSITVVSTSLIVSNNNTLTNLDGLGSVTATCEVSANLELSDIDGLSNLTSVGVQFSITNNPKLCALPLWVSNVTAPSTSFVGNGTDPSCP
jgi:hypothetical protein